MAAEVRVEVDYLKAQRDEEVIGEGVNAYQLFEPTEQSPLQTVSLFLTSKTISLQRSELFPIELR